MTPEGLFEANLALAPFVLHKYFGSFDEDELQEGYLSLWKAACAYRQDSGAAFSTFAAAVICNDVKHRRYLEGMQCRKVEQEKVSLFVTDADGEWAEMDIPHDADLEGTAVVGEFWRRARNELSEREYRIIREKSTGRTCAEIGQALGISKQAVAQMIHRRPLELAWEVFGG